MRELSYVIAFVAGLALLAAAGAWFKIARNPKNDLTAGGGGKPATERLKRASRLLAIALGLSGLAVVVAVIGWFLQLLKV
jgi:hypothetical protein